MKNFLRDNGLSLVLAAIFLLLLAGQAFTGWHVYNEEELEHGSNALSLRDYLGTGHFMESVFENWESEFLQMAAYVVLTAFLFQKGSAESNDPEGEESETQLSTHTPRPLLKGGWKLKLYEHSLSLALLGLFAVSFIGHLLGGARLHNQENLQHGKASISVGQYLGSSQFWFESFQNWQSEFLAVLAIVVLSIWLREKNSAESKEMTAPHSSTGK
ncbi:MAG TPA: DUF6766 family protein [Verrucomicrobiae bacterium]